MNNSPFIAGPIPSQPQPLEDYLPKFSPPVFAAWLERSYPQPNLLLDPFGSSPRALTAVAREGYRVLAAINNPITRFMVRYTAGTPSATDLQSALATLASTFKGKERLEPHILSLYETDCPQCGRKISAQAFIWNRKDTAPDRKLCHCPHCHNQGEYPTSQFDIDKAQQYQDDSLYHARALTRIAPPDDPIRAHAENALQLYTPRAVYALFTLINKLSGLSLTAQVQQHINALLLHAFYISNNLWPYPERGRGIHGLAPPATYREMNVWFALEEAVNLWHSEEEAVQVTRWPDLPSVEGGIAVYPGRFKDLANDLEEAFGAGIMVVPRPNPTFWSLSALWAGWLWGQEKAAPLRNILSLREPDWPWHTRALQDTFSSLYPFLKPDNPCFAILPSSNPPFLSSAFTAAHTSGFVVDSIALDPHRQETQIVWKRRDSSELLPTDETPKAIIRNAGYSHLAERGEPSYTISLHAAGLTAMDQEDAFPRDKKLHVEDLYRELTHEVEETFAYRQGFLHFPDSDTWWHQELSLDITPLSDEVEMALVNQLVDSPSPLRRIELENMIFASYPGLRTPSSALIQVCLESYAEHVQPQEEGWQIKKDELPAARRRDLNEMENLLQDLGTRLGFEVQRKAPRGNIQVSTWSTGEKTAYTFFISASGILAKLVLGQPQPPPNPWIVLPGSRADLVAYKLRNNEPLARLVEENWGFLKYRHLQRLADDDSLTRANLAERLSLDPLKYDAPQLPLI